MADILRTNELPEGFVYPEAFLRSLDSWSEIAPPWWLDEGDLLRERQRYLSERFPARDVILFAGRGDNDDVACFETRDASVVVLHNLTDPGYERPRSYPNFEAWFEVARAEAAEFRTL